MPGGTRRAYFESPPRPDWRKRAAGEGNNPVFTPAEYRSMGFEKRPIVVVVLPAKTGRTSRYTRRAPRKVR